MVQRVSSDNSVGSTLSDEIATIMKREVADRGCRITGGCATFGRVYASVSRSWIICLAFMMSVPRLKVSKIDDRPVTDCDRIDASQGTPESSSSRLRVIRLCTSSADSPIASVWTSTTGGANSGKTSTGVLRSWAVPNTINAAASPSTR